METAQPLSQNTRKLLLHACCGPCSLEPSRILSAEGYDLTIYYANSNIEPESEYEHREQTIESWAQESSTPFVEGPYRPETWEETVGHIGDAALADANGSALDVEPARREARCRACYRMRFEEAASYAADHGYPALGTTLSVSPYQYTDVIREELERACEREGIEAVFRDFRPNYPEATRRSREMGMYRQNYCGCRFSDAEAAAERAERKEERRRAKESYAAEHAAEREAAERAREDRRAERAAYDEKQRRKHEVLKELRERKRAADAAANAAAAAAKIAASAATKITIPKPNRPGPRDS